MIQTDKIAEIINSQNHWTFCSDPSCKECKAVKEYKEGLTKDIAQIYKEEDKKIKTTKEIIDFDYECRLMINSRSTEDYENEKLNDAVEGIKEKKWIPAGEPFNKTQWLKIARGEE